MTVDRAYRLIDDAERIRLDGTTFVKSFPIEDVARCGNGIGPEWLPKKCRRLLDWWYSDFRPAALIHDCRYTFDPDRSEKSRLSANEEFRTNCLKISSWEYAWWNPIRYIARARAKELYSMCDLFGRSVWEKGGRKTS